MHLEYYTGRAEDSRWAVFSTKDGEIVSGSLFDMRIIESGLNSGQMSIDDAKEKRIEPYLATLSAERREAEDG